MKVGKTKQAGFQMGVRKTLNIQSQLLWEFLTIPDGMKPILGQKIGKELMAGTEGKTDNGLSFRVTTFVPHSHMRMQWKLPDWDNHSILQIRVIRSSNDRSVLSIHQEKLSDNHQRTQMLEHWKNAIREIESLLTKYY